MNGRKILVVFVLFSLLVSLKIAPILLDQIGNSPKQSLSSSTRKNSFLIKKIWELWTRSRTKFCLRYLRQILFLQIITESPSTLLKPEWRIFPHLKFKEKVFNSFNGIQFNFISPVCLCFFSLQGKWMPEILSAIELCTFQRFVIVVVVECTHSSLK